MKPMHESKSIGATTPEETHHHFSQCYVRASLALMASLTTPVKRQSCICRKGVRKRDYSRGPGDTRAVADLSAVTPGTIPAADRRTQSTGPRFAPV